MKKNLYRTLVVALLTTFVWACGITIDPTPLCGCSPVVTLPDILVGKWEFVGYVKEDSLDIEKEKLKASTPDFPANLEVLYNTTAANRKKLDIAGSSSVNTYNGEITLGTTDSSWRAWTPITSGAIAQTKMAGSNEAMAFEIKYLNGLSVGEKVKIEDGMNILLRVKIPNDEMLFVRKR